MQGTHTWYMAERWVLLVRDAALPGATVSCMLIRREEKAKGQGQSKWRISGSSHRPPPV